MGRYSKGWKALWPCVLANIVCQDRKQCSQLQVRYGKEGGGGPSDAGLTCGTSWIGWSDCNQHFSIGLSDYLI